MVHNLIAENRDAKKRESGQPRSLSQSDEAASLKFAGGSIDKNVLVSPEDDAGMLNNLNNIPDPNSSPDPLNEEQNAVIIFADTPEPTNPALNVAAKTITATELAS